MKKCDFFDKITFQIFCNTILLIIKLMILNLLPPIILRILSRSKFFVENTKENALKKFSFLKKTIGLVRN